MKFSLIRLVFTLAIPWISNCQDESRLSTWYKRVKDPSFECPPINAEQQDLPPNSPEVYTVVDCDEIGARWDYNYKTDSKSKPGKIFDGLSSLTFAHNGENGKFKFGFKYGKCIKPFNKNIRQIKGKFVKDSLEGPVTIDYVDQSFVVGYSRGNRLTGVLRHFDEKNDLVNVTEAETGNVYWVRDRFGNYRFQSFQQSDSNRVLLTDNFQDVLNCEQTDSVHMIDCSVVQKYQQEDFSTEGCIAVLGQAKFEPLKSEKEVFKFNARTQQRHNSSDPLYPECPEQENWNDQNIRKEIESWKMSLFKKEDLGWYHDPELEPLNLKNPRIKITFDQFVNRQSYQSHKVIIMSSDRKLFEGPMINGSLDFEIPEEIAKLPDWKSPVHIGIVSGKSLAGAELFHGVALDFRADSPMENFVLLASGRLRHGKLHGLVVVNGVMSNDPRSRCEKAVVPGLGFVGHLKDGVAVGPCWRELVGGAWIYGEVNEEGLLSGDHIAYVYPDFKTAFVGKFNRGLMIEGREAEVVGEKCNSNGIKMLKFTQPFGPVYHYDPPNSTYMGDQPLLGDPLDNRYMDLKTSEKYPVAGEGAFAKEDVPAMTIYSLYGGLILTREEAEEKKEKKERLKIEKKLTIRDSEVIDDWKYRHGIPLCDLTIDIPPEFEPVSKFRGTVGHKVNHVFNPETVYTNIDSARFGIINAVMAIKPVAKGEEFFASYGYGFDIAPPWYKDLFLQFMDQHPEEAGIIHKISGGRTKAQLLEAYEKYLKLGPETTMTDLTMGSLVKEEKKSEINQDATNQPAFNI